MKTDDAKQKSVLPDLNLTRILKPCHKKNDRNTLLGNQEQTIPCEINYVA